jgi:beta-glucosidase
LLQQELIEQLAAPSPRTVVVIEFGEAITSRGRRRCPPLSPPSTPVTVAGWRSPCAVRSDGPLWAPAGDVPESIDQLPGPEQHDRATTTSKPNMERIGEIFEVSYDMEGSDVGYRWFERAAHARRPL